MLIKKVVLSPGAKKNSYKIGDTFLKFNDKEHAWLPWEACNI